MMIKGDIGPGLKGIINTPLEVKFHVDSKSGCPTFVLCLVDPKKAAYEAYANKVKFPTLRFGWFKVVPYAKFQGDSEYPGPKS
jgi:hypothetical protein